jgi:hypothetical protein
LLNSTNKNKEGIFAFELAGRTVEKNLEILKEQVNIANKKALVKGPF